MRVLCHALVWSVAVAAGAGSLMRQGSALRDQFGACPETDPARMGRWIPLPAPPPGTQVAAIGPWLVATGPADTTAFDECTWRWQAFRPPAAPPDTVSSHYEPFGYDEHGTAPLPGIRVGSRRVAWSFGPFLRSIDTLAAAQAYDEGGHSLGSPTGDAPSPRWGFIYCAHERHLLIWGGYSKEPRPLVDGAVLDVQEMRWRPVSSQGAPSLRGSPVLACRGKRLVVLGGGSIDRPGTNLEGGFVYDLVADRWTPIPGVPPLNACTPVLPVDRGRIIIGAAFGSGCSPEPPRVLGIVDAVAAHWSAIPFPPPPIHQAWGWTGSRLLVFGGEPPVINPCSLLRPPHPGCDAPAPPHHYVREGYAFAPAVAPVRRRAPHKAAHERHEP